MMIVLKVNDSNKNDDNDDTGTEIVIKIIILIIVLIIIILFIIIFTLSLALTSAPFDTSKVTISKCPLLAASCNGVIPYYGINGDSN